MADPGKSYCACKLQPGELGRGPFHWRETEDPGVFQGLVAFERCPRYRKVKKALKDAEKGLAEVEEDIAGELGETDRWHTLRVERDQIEDNLRFYRSELYYMSGRQLDGEEYRAGSEAAVDRALEPGPPQPEERLLGGPGAPPGVREAGEERVHGGLP